jgi:hypothetical protein
VIEVFKNVSDFQINLTKNGVEGEDEDVDYWVGGDGFGDRRLGFVCGRGECFSKFLGWRERKKLTTRVVLFEIKLDYKGEKTGLCSHKIKGN